MTTRSGSGSLSGCVTIVPLGEQHLERAAALFAARYRVARQREPLLPPNHERPEEALPRLRDLMEEHRGLIAMREDRVVGFMTGMVLPAFRGQRSMYVPEWAHAAQADECQEIHRALYTHLAARWVADGCCQHVITVLADDREAFDTCVWLGFGLEGLDTVRGLEPVAGEPVDIRTRRATPADGNGVLRLALRLQEHLRAEPVFLVPSPLDRHTVERWLADPNEAVFLAEQDGTAVAHLRVMARAEVQILEDPGTATIRTTFTDKAHRGRGVCTALLNRALAWARDRGCTRCAVGFESPNTLAYRFWLRHFRPVCYSLIRRVDERILQSPQEATPCQPGHSPQQVEEGQQR